MTDHAWEMIQRIDKKLDDVQLSLATFVSAQTEVCKTQRERSAAIYTTVFGNGSPGLKQNVARLMEAEATRRKVMAATLTLILTNIGAILTFIFGN